MIGWISDFHFLRPWWLLLLVIPLFGYRSFFSGLKNISAWEAVCDKKLLDFLLVKGSSSQRRFIGYTALVGIVGAILALAGPSWQKKNVPAFVPANPVILLLNLSSDMEANDITPNRLLRAKFAVADLLKSLRAQVGLIVYTDEPYIISPITDDRQLVVNLLPAVGRDIMPTNGDKLGRAIDLAVERLKHGNYPRGTIIVFTSDAGQEFNSALDACTAAAYAGYRVNVVAVRSSDSEKLRLLVNRGKGVLLNVNDSFDKLAADINGEVAAELKKLENKREVWEDGGYYLLFVPLVCCLYFFRRGILVLLLWFSLSVDAFAGFFMNADQEGAYFFAAEDYNAAAKIFRRSDWKASALYRNGDYVGALKYFQEGHDTESLYNQGNALAKIGKIEEAIAKYEEVLNLVPTHEDAKFNLEYLKQQQEQQNQDQNDSDGNKEQNTQQNQGQSSHDDDSSSQKEQVDNRGYNPVDNRQNDGRSDDSSEPSLQNSGNDGDGNSRPIDGSKQKQAHSGSEHGQSADGTESTEPSGREPGKKSDEDADGKAGSSDRDAKNEFDEQIQAREMSYRNIPEDIGGLLRAFIRKEYNKNRYGDK